MATKMKFVTALLISATLGFPMASFGQTSSVDTAKIVADCAKSAAACQLAIEQAIALLKSLGLTPAQLNTQLGVLAGAALEGAKDLPPTEKLALAGTLNAISAESTDTTQKAALQQLAGDLAAGKDIDLAAFASAISSN